MFENKFKQLEKSFEEGLINKKEFEKKKKELQNLPEPKRKVEEETKESKLTSDKSLIVAVILLILLFAFIFITIRYFNPDPPGTIDELHEFNLLGKLKPEQGYIYNEVYSFVKFEDLWYTQLLSPKGTRLYDIQFRYGPKELEDITIGGTLNIQLFNDAQQYYVTFNPAGNDFSTVALAAADFNQQMVNIFFKEPIAACDRNETLNCIDRPIITCDNTDKVVLYIKESINFKVYFDDNCIVVEGSGFDLVKGVDRILYNLYDIMD